MHDFYLCVNPLGVLRDVLLLQQLLVLSTITGTRECTPSLPILVSRVRVALNTRRVFEARQLYGVLYGVLKPVYMAVWQGGGRQILTLRGICYGGVFFSTVMHVTCTAVVAHLTFVGVFLLA